MRIGGYPKVDSMVAICGTVRFTARVGVTETAFVPLS